MDGIRTRIAPTPSGFLHVGNAINFLITHQLARAGGGAILLRIDDLDAERTRQEYVEDIFESLHWLGIDRDEGPRDSHEFHRHWSQTSRTGAAHEMLDRLHASGALFACTCSRSRSAHCTCREQDLPFDGQDATWRLRIPRPCEVHVPGLFSDGWIVDLGSQLPDPVVKQRNGMPAYQLASLADDVRFRMDVIVRGEDLLPSSACQYHIASLLGLTQFLGTRFLHHPLLMDERGHKLSKSAGSDSLRSLRASGADPQALREQAAEVLERLRAQGL